MHSSTSTTAKSSSKEAIGINFHFFECITSPFQIRNLVSLSDLQLSSHKTCLLPLPAAYKLRATSLPQSGNTFQEPP
ncbi:hypothetical protein [Rubritalea tangerina]|uniref:hypothetical protein n=1 Tax=Rubritalea tangerina TaxID=430798 RepID=UPI00360B8BEA